MDHIIDQALSIYSRFGSDDLDAVAKELGVFIYDLLESEHLKEAYFPALGAVAIRPGLPQHERRYLIAHAIGHHLFHKGGPARDYIGLHTREHGVPAEARPEIAKAESEADLFASYLLIPDARLRPLLAYDWVKAADDPALSLALEFQVPVEAMRVRLVFEKCRQLGNAL